MWHDPQQLQHVHPKALWLTSGLLLSRRVIAYYGLIRASASESLPATYGFAAGAAAPKENRLEVGNPVVTHDS